jgi:hypothetical protein
LKVLVDSTDNSDEGKSVSTAAQKSYMGYRRIITRSPRRQLSANPTRMISISGERYLRIASVVG